MAQDKRLPQLHEILAVEPDLMKAMRKITEETKHTLKDKANLFVSWVKTYKAIAGPEDPEDGHQDFQEMTTTVSEKLEYTSEFIAKAIDITAQ